MGLQDYRQIYKPFEYQEPLDFISQINKTYWTHDEVKFDGDLQDYNSFLTPDKRSYTKRSMLMVSTVEVAVKMFWGGLYGMFPKPELNGLGMTLAENEWRHSEAYSRLGDVVGFNDELRDIMNVPAVKAMVDFLNAELPSNDVFTKIGLFGLLVENGLLFESFATIYSNTRFDGVMKNISNMVAWTSVDEQVHANVATWLLNTLNAENPMSAQEKADKEEEFKKVILRFMELQKGVRDWIFEKGEPDHFTKTDLENFTKKRIDDALSNIGFSKIFNITETDYEPMEWFDEEVFADTLDDFFAKRPVDYTKHDKPVTGDDLF